MGIFRGSDAVGSALLTFEMLCAFTASLAPNCLVVLVGDLQEYLTKGAVSVLPFDGNA